MSASFSALAATGCPPHAELALCLAAEFADVDIAAVDEQLERLAAPLIGLRDRPAHCQLQAGCALALKDLTATRERAGIRSLLLPDVLRRGRGHVVILAVLAVEAGRRAGLPLGIVASSHATYVGHRDVDGVLVDPTRPDRPTEAGTLDQPDLRWRCAHETCLTLLNEIVDNAMRSGAINHALRAAELRLALPLDEPSMQRWHDELDAVRSWSN